eukprot:CFRG7885T1
MDDNDPDDNVYDKYINQMELLSVPQSEGFSESDEEKSLTANATIKSYDECLEYSGTGRYHLTLLLACGLANASDAVEILAIAFVLPSAESDLSMTDEDKGYITAIIFVGMMFGGWLWGSWADTWGRRRCLQMALGVNSLFSFLSACAPNVWMLVLLRFISGIGVGGSIPVVWTYMCEFIPQPVRGTWMSYLASSWMIGAFMCTVIAWMVIPIFGWRIFLCATAMPSASACVALQFTDESPKFLISIGAVDEGEDILKRIYRINHCKTIDRTLDMSSGVRAASGAISTSMDIKKCLSFGNVNNAMRDIVRKISPLFDSRTGLRHLTFVLLSIWVGLSYGFYGLSLWLPQYFTDLTEMNVYKSTMMVALAQLPGNVFTASYLDKFGRNKILFASLAFSGAFVFVLSFPASGNIAVAASIMFNGLSVVSWNALDVATVELYPTYVRSTAFGTLSAAGRLSAIAANITFGYLLRTHPFVPLFVTASMLILGGIMALALPSPTRGTLLR